MKVLEFANRKVLCPTYEDGDLDNSKRAALEEEYAVLCSPGDVPIIQEGSSSEAGHAHQSGFPQASGSETTTPGPASGRKRKASSQSPVASTSKSAGSQSKTGSASSRARQSK